MDLKKMLGFDSQTMNIKTEIVAGVTTFLSMTYILAVNPEILSAAGMDKGAVFTATALASAIATLLLAFMAKMPFAQAPSMGLNAFFAYTLVIGMGYQWETALAAVFVEGIIFILLTAFNIREKVVDCIPASLRYAISAGIGMFIAFIGLKNAGIIDANPATFVTLGKFTPSSILAMVGIILSGVLLIKKVKGALFYSIIICTLAGIPFGITTIPEDFSLISMPKSIAPTFMKFDFAGLLSYDMLIIIFTLVFMDMFNTVGTLIGTATKANMMDSEGKLPRMKEAMMADAIGTSVGAVLGTSTVSTYVESALGIAEGGRSGLTALVVGLLFIFSLFFAPIFMLIPAAATTGALVIVGVLMMESIKHIELDDISEALPAFITMMMMVLTYSIAEGIILGMLCYVLVKFFSNKRKDIVPSMYVLGALFILKYILA